MKKAAVEQSPNPIVLPVQFLLGIVFTVTVFSAGSHGLSLESIALIGLNLLANMGISWRIARCRLHAGVTSSTAFALPALLFSLLALVTQGVLTGGGSFLFWYGIAQLAFFTCLLGVIVAYVQDRQQTEDYSLSDPTPF